jgi:hypothetical protein
VGAVLLAAGQHGLVELAQQLLLALGEVDRGLHQDPADEIPHGALRTDFTPLPRMRNILPVWVPGGILSTTLPSRVGT